MLSKAVHLIAATLVLTALVMVSSMSIAPAAGNATGAAAVLDPEPCLQSIGLMGASMGHTAGVAPDGRPVLQFELRANDGVEYSATCDAESGMVSDVEIKPRRNDSSY